MIDGITGILKQGIKRSRALTEFAQSLQFELEHPPDGPVIMVHEMANSGSATVAEVLRQRFPRGNIYHTYYLNPDTIRLHYRQFIELYKRTGRADLHNEFLAARALERRLRTRRVSRWKIITLVGDPVARTVSAFFKHFRVNNPQYEPRYSENPEHVDRLIELFLADDEHERSVTLEWFDREVRDVLGIDVFASPFPRETGWEVYHTEACDMLLMRLEDLDRVGPQAMGEFLRIDDVALAPMNRSEQEPYAPVMAAFLERIRLPDQFLDLLYGSRLARHFYSESELAAFRQRWLRD